MFARFPLATAAGVLRLWPAALVSLALSACQSAQDTTSLELALVMLAFLMLLRRSGTPR